MAVQDEDTDGWLVVTPRSAPRKNTTQPPPTSRPSSSPTRPPTTSQSQQQPQRPTKPSNSPELPPGTEEMALCFFRWLHESPGASSERKSLSTGITRDAVGKLFRNFLLETVISNDDDDDDKDGSSKSKKNKPTKRPPKKNKNKLPKHHRQLEGFVMRSLREQKRLRSQRYDKDVICVFATADGRSFAPIEDIQSARQKLREQRKQLRADKDGIEITEAMFTEEPTSPLVPMNESITLVFMVIINETVVNPTDLMGISVNGSHRRHFTLVTPTKEKNLETGYLIKFTFRSTRIAAHRANITFHFARRIPNESSSSSQPKNNKNSKNNKKNKRPYRTEKTKILRDVLLRTGDPELYGVLEAKKPYKKRKKHDKEKRVDPKDVVHPPKDKRGGGGYNKNLGKFPIPKDTRRQVESGELEDGLFPPWTIDGPLSDTKFDYLYTNFWQKLLWASELQAYDDIRFFDMERVALERKGRLLKLMVQGLAEGRPSVLKGDLVVCLWKNKEYRGRVTTVGNIDVLLEFHASFHRTFDPRVDRIDRVRFTVPRTAFRTAHAGILQAPQSMGRAMLMPSQHHIPSSVTNRDSRSSFRWSTSQLNKEQKHAVTEIVKGSYRPLPYIIFGPPGTGKTTTLVEAIYQLTVLQDDLKILVVAPSNDATDILVEKLSRLFPPSELVRVLAYTRSIDKVPEPVRPYCTADGLEGDAVLSKILRSKITVSTVNMAARFWCTGNGLPKGHFDVLCVDEAGHATEPEIIAVAATAMEYKKKKGQLVLAGDPMQLGPIVTSELCKIFKMDRSYLERLVQTSPAYRLEDNSNQYPPQLVTLLVNNYRSHHHILKLPNEMFYRNQLVAKGDLFTTHSMAKWEHLPTKGFPMLVHAVDGENTREGNSPSWFNPQEAMVVVDYVRKLTEQSKPKIASEDIGIITPYARQVQKIQLALKVSGMENIKVGSVETFQGQERRVIIISTVRSENSLLQHDLKYNLGFVANEKRFNVAVTRAKALLIVVGNPKVLATDTKNWLPLLRFCKSKRSWLGEDWDEEEASSSDDDVASIESESEEHDKNEWAPAAQESFCVINREE